MTAASPRGFAVTENPVRTSAHPGPARVLGSIAPERTQVVREDIDARAADPDRPDSSASDGGAPGRVAGYWCKWAR